MNKNIIPDIEDTLDLSKDEFIDKYVGDIFDVDAEAILYERLYRFVNKYDDYLIKYNYWYRSNDTKAIPGGQIDFIVCKKEIGFALLEVKAGKFTQVKLDTAFHQTLKGNYSLNSDINVYNIVFFPEDELDDIKKNQYINNNDKKDKTYILDKKDFNKWDKPEEIKKYFDDFFNDERRYRVKKTNTDKIIAREFDIENYNKDREMERIVKEQKLINDKTKIINIVKNSGFNCFVLRGYSGTGKTFIAMNIAKDSEKNVLYICRNSELIKAISKYFDNDISFNIEDSKYTNYKYPISGKEQIEKAIYKSSINSKTLTLYKLNLEEKKVNWSELEKLTDENDLIIIDEVQDSGYKEIKLLLDKVINDKDKQLYLVGDRKQFTNEAKRQDFNSINNVILKLKNDKQILYLDLGDDNCRNDIDIKRFIYKLIDKTYLDEQTIINRIKVVFTNNFDEQNKRIADWIEKEKKDIIVINNETGKLNIREKYLSSNYVKGCEYNEVVLIGCKKCQLLYSNEFEIDRQQLSQAAGRAKKELTLVFYTKNDDEKKEIKDILQNDYKFDENCFI
ncbi:MAG: AAA family ATPase [Lachnospiraceae bacterium]|nr:AAA family ATPase [Lachnospiraceae bacterium]